MVERIFNKLRGWLDNTVDTQYEKISTQYKNISEPQPIRAVQQRTVQQDPVNKSRQTEKQAVRDLKRLGIVNIDRHSKALYIEAYQLLAEGKFLQFCCELINDYHAGDTKLSQLMMRAALRVIFSSTSALLHVATTGKAGAGKNDLIENVIALMPEDHVVRYAAITSKNLWYELEETVPGQKKKVVNPYHFANKIICVTEIADSTGYSGLKGFAELNEQTVATYKATRALALEVKGTRALWIASVSGVKSDQEDKDQVNRRFINNVIESSSNEKQRAKIRAVTSSLINQTSISGDPRTQIARAGFELLFASMPLFEPPTNEVAQMVEDLVTMLDDEGYSPSRWKQLYALAECAAVERQFQRGYCRVERQDLIEAWWLTGFALNKDALLNGEWCKAQMGEIKKGRSIKIEG